MLTRNLFQYLLLQGYTNADNPFGDEHLLDTFVWSKKLEREGKKHIPMSEIQRMQKAKLIESKVYTCSVCTCQLALARNHFTPAIANSPKMSSFLQYSQNRLKFDGKLSFSTPPLSQ